MMDIVTGGAGFIGSHLVDHLLAQDRKVKVIDNTENLVHLPHKWDLVPERLAHLYDCSTQTKLHKNLEWEDKDVATTEFDNDLDFSGAERVFHLAGLADIVPSIENPEEYYNTNVTGTLRVLQAARKAGVKKFIYAASASCYGSLLPQWPITEMLLENPAYPYALTKCMGEQLVLHWAKIYGMDCISLRLFNVYGLRSRTNGAYGAMFGTFLAQIANNQPLTIVGDGTQQRDFVHVSDVVKAFAMAADSDKSGVYNVGSGQPTSVNCIVELLEKGLEATPQYSGNNVLLDIIHIPKRPGEPDITCADITKIRNDVGWEPRVSIEEGVKELLDHLDDYKGAPLWTPDTIGVATKTWFEYLS